MPCSAAARSVAGADLAGDRAGGGVGEEVEDPERGGEHDCRRRRGRPSGRVPRCPTIAVSASRYSGSAIERAERGDREADDLAVVRAGPEDLHHGLSLSHPGAMLCDVENLPALRFADAARRLGGASAARPGWRCRAFRCPPRIAGAARTIRRYPGGTVVSVRLRGRPFEAALDDMVEGVLVANRVEPPEAVRVRAALEDAVHDEVRAEAA